MSEADETPETVLAYLMILTTSEGTEPLIETLRNDDRIAEAHVVYGDVDIIAKVQVPSLVQLTAFVMELRKNPDVKSTNTLIVVLE